MPTNPSALSVISGHLEKFASCPVPKSSSSTSPGTNSRLKHLGNGGSSSCDIDVHLSNNAKLILMTKIDFKKAEMATSTQFNEQLKAKYINLSAGLVREALQAKTPEHKTLSTPSTSGTSSPVEPAKTPPTQKRVLYPPERVRLQWCRPVPVGAGLVNSGNTCFLNSTLQALTHTAPLFNYLVSEQHARTCRLSGFCMLCAMERLMIESYGSNSRAIEPTDILRKLQAIAKHLRFGRQEDAHEFLRFAIDKMQQNCWQGNTKLDPELKETTAMNAIFGGSIRSTVICQGCQGKSEKIDPIMDLCLELKHANTLQQALEHFVKPETLTGDNAYKCPSCKKPQTARKMLTINKAPNVMTFQLKRFGIGFSLFGGAKITRSIEFHERFNLKNFMSNKTGPEISYNLYAVVVHEGMSANSGHYYAYVKHGQQWYMMNDTVVKSVSVKQVLQCQAYILFYIRENESPPDSSLITPVKQAATAPNCSQSASKLVSTSTPQNRPSVIPSSAPPIKMVIKLNQNGGVGTPVSSNAPKIIAHTQTPLVVKRPAQVITGGASSQNTLIKVAAPVTPPMASKPVTTAPIVTATRPLVDFDPSDSDDEDGKGRLVIDEQAIGGASTAPLPISSSSKANSDQDAPPVIKFLPPKPSISLSRKEVEPQVDDEDGEKEAESLSTTNSSESKRRKQSIDDEEKESSDHHHKKHKKHRHSRKRRHSESDVEENGAASNVAEDEEESTSEKKQKKKKKKKSKKHRHHSSESEQTPSNKLDDNEDDEDVSGEWVEKQVAPPESTTPQPSEAKTFPLPPSYHPQNSVAQNGYPTHHSSTYSLSNQPPMALGAHVATWDGSLNSIDAALTNGNRERISANEAWKRQFDAELDIGHQKKIKQKFSAREEFEYYGRPSSSEFHNGNAFQSVQNARMHDRESNTHGSRRNSNASSRVSTPDMMNGGMTNGHSHQNVPLPNGYPAYQPNHQQNRHRYETHNGGNEYGHNNDHHSHNQNGFHEHHNGKFSRQNNSFHTPPSKAFRNGNGDTFQPYQRQYPNSAPRYNNGNHHHQNNNQYHNGNQNWRGGGYNHQQQNGSQNHQYRKQYSAPFQ